MALPAFLKDKSKEEDGAKTAFLPKKKGAKGKGKVPPAFLKHKGKKGSKTDKVRARFEKKDS